MKIYSLGLYSNTHIFSLNQMVFLQLHHLYSLLVFGMNIFVHLVLNKALQ
jgi:hypothetical protein